MINWFMNLSYPMMALYGTLFTWFVTALGSALVFFCKKINKTFMDATLGFAAGVMIAAAFFSLLSPAIEMAESLKLTSWLVVVVGVILGVMLLFVSDMFFDKIQSKKNIGNSSSFKRCLMLIFSITIHNIPEGLAVGVAFGSLAYNLDGATLASACMLALGIGLQNFPEGMAVSLPLRRENFSLRKSFFFGQLSGFVEPISGLLGSLLVIKVRILLPYLLAFAAGAMIYVVVQELIPESQTNKKKGLITSCTLLGFVIMMMMDLALG